MLAAHVFADVSSQKSSRQLAEKNRRSLERALTEVKKRLLAVQAEIPEQVLMSLFDEGEPSPVTTPLFTQEADDIAAAEAQKLHDLRDIRMKSLDTVVLSLKKKTRR